jgi:zinc transport system substrate-binding protein
MATACTSPAGEAQDGRLAVYASIYPLYDFAVKVGGDKVSVHSVMPAGAEPHDWEPTPQDIVRLEDAGVLLYNGLGMEHWIGSVLASVNSPGLVAVDTSAEALRLGGFQLSADTGHGSGSDDGHGHDAAADPHFWLSIPNARLQAQAVAEALSKADPGNAAYYADNLAAYQAELDQLDAEYREALGAAPSHRIVVAHAAYGYLCHEYGLEQISARGFSPEQEPDPASLAEVVDFCRANNIKTIFFESAADPKTAAAIAAETGAAVDILTPLESVTQAEIDNGEDYLSLMRRNLEALVRAL